MKPAFYGLIGYPLSHSFSKAYFTEKFQTENINAIYENYPLTDISQFEALISTHNFSGLNVTIPYKEKIIPYLDELQDEALEIQAVNCIAFQEKRCIGYNTDVFGFKHAIQPYIKHRNNALILGTGGASKAIALALKQLDISYRFVSRQPSKNQFTYDEAHSLIQDCSIIINTTPVGMYPYVNESPLKDFSNVGKHHVCYDAIYNPKETLFLSKASEKGAQTINGLEMLTLQAEESWRIWSQQTATKK